MQVRLLSSLILSVLLCVSATASNAEEPPFPMLDTGGHRGTVVNLAFTHDGKYLVSASEDKTIRVWDWRKNKTVRIIRGQSGLGNYGLIYAAALSPDDRWLAVSGSMLSAQGQDGAGIGDIRLYDFATGVLTALLKGHTKEVGRLAFSIDGKQLISGQGGDDGHVNVWDVGKHTLLRELADHKAPVNALQYADRERIVIATEDHKLQLRGIADGALLKDMTGHRDKVWTLAVSPVSGVIASGDVSGEIRLWNSRTGAFLQRLEECHAVGSLSFSPDGRLLLATCFDAGHGDHDQVVFDVATAKKLTTYPKEMHKGGVIASAFSPDGHLVATAGGQHFEIRIWNPFTGNTEKVLQGSGHSVAAAGTSSDGTRIAWGYDFDGHQLEWTLRLPAASRGSSLAAPEPVTKQEGWIRSQTSHGSLSLEAVKGEDGALLSVLNIKENGTAHSKPIIRTHENGYIHGAYGFSPDGQRVYSGGGLGFLDAYSTRDSSMIRKYIGHDGRIWELALTPNGKYLVSASEDQTVRLWNAETGEPLVSVFQGDDKEWVIWTPQGYYAASGPGSELIGWQINHGPEHEAEYVTAAQLRKKLNRPDIVARAIQLASAGQAVKEAYGTDFKLSDLLAKPVPRLRIVSPAQDAALRGGSAELEIALGETLDPVKAIRIQVNGRQIDERLPDSGPGFAPGSLKFTVPLAKGRNTIRIVAVNNVGETPAEVAVTHEGDGALDSRGTLYILAVGVDKYPNLGKACRELDGKTPKTCDLNVAGADAKAFAETMAARLGPLHGRVVSRVLVNGGADGEPSAENIADALGDLKQATANDTVAMFLSGHGITEGLNYNFVATNAAFRGEGFRGSTVVPWANFQLALEGAKGRRILFLDTCHSGNSYNERLTNDAYQANIVVYSAARWDQEALERGDLGHGLFTYALVEGVNGAAKDGGGEVRAEGLRDFLSKRVPEMAKAMKRDQEPQYFRGRDAENYVLARP